MGAILIRTATFVMDDTLVINAILVLGAISDKWVKNIPKVDPHIRMLDM